MDSAGCSAVPSRRSVTRIHEKLKNRRFLFFGISAIGNRILYYVYIIESLKDNSYYIGQTQELESRLKRHNDGRNLYTKSYRPWRLKWWKEYATRSEAIREENKLKGIKKREGIERFMIKNNFRGVAQSG